MLAQDNSSNLNHSAVALHPVPPLFYLLSPLPLLPLIPLFSPPPPPQQHNMTPEEVSKVDVLIIGAGPAGYVIICRE
jgi:hypothetical protein